MFMAFLAWTGRFTRDYEILSEVGTPLRQVRNDPGNMLGGPIRAELSSGAFRVVARANGYGVVTVRLPIHSIPRPAPG